MRKIAICDDITSILDYIKSTCEEFYFNKGIVEITCFRTGEAILNSDKHFDVIFMDVELGCMTGIETSLNIRESNLDVLIIMISAHEHYKLDAYPLHVFNFIDKPFTKTEITDVLSSVEKYFDNRKNQVYVSFKMREGITSIDLMDILYLESVNRKIILVTKKKRYEFYSTIKEQAQRLKEFGFYVPHSSFIVNFRYVKAIRSKEIMLFNGITISLSKYKAKEFKENYALFLKNQIRNGRV